MGGRLAGRDGGFTEVRGVLAGVSEKPGGAARAPMN